MENPKVKMLPVTDAAVGVSYLEYKTPGSAGADLCYNGDSVCLNPGERYLFSTGIALAIPPGFEGQIRTRSGLASKFGLFVLNSPGTIDSDYRGEVKVLLANLGKGPALVAQGTRIAQLVIAPVARAEFILVSELDETERGGGGFGSTGIM